MSDYEYSSQESREQFQRILRRNDARREREAQRELGIGSQYQNPRGAGAPGPDREKLAQLPESGYSVIDPQRGGSERGGTHAHRGVIDEGEHVDHETLISMVEDELGYSFEESRLAFDPFALKDEVPNYYAIRNRMIDIYESGGNIMILADILGVKRTTLSEMIRRETKRREES